MGWKRIPRHNILQKGVSLLRTKSRDKVGIVSIAGQPPDRPGRADSFHGSVANFYSLKTKKILPEGWCSVTGRGAIGCLLEWASLPNWKSGRLLMMIREGFGKITKRLSQLQR